LYQKDTLSGAEKVTKTLENLAECVKEHDEDDGESLKKNTFSIIQNKNDCKH